MKRPHRFQIEINNPFDSGTIYTFADGAIEVVRANERICRATPNLERWSGFWRLCEFLELWDWRPHYDAADLDFAVRDGDDWTLHIAFDKSKSVTSSGFNAYPSLKFIQHTALTHDRFGLLLQCIDGTILDNSVGNTFCFASEEFL